MIRTGLKLREAVKGWAVRHRRAVLAVAGTAFVVFAWLSVRALDLSIATVDWRLMALAAATVPAAVWLNATELRLCGDAVGSPMRLGPAVLHSSVAALANILPLPAGFAWRARAIKQNGAGWIDAGRILVLAGVLWLALALGGVGVALIETPLGLALAAAAVLASGGIVAWIAHRAGTRIAAGFLLVRLGALGVLVLRLAITFAAIGHPLPFADAGVFAVAGVVGNGVAIVPSGLGVVEGIGALMATLVSVPPEAAFVALAVGRLFGYAAALLCLLPWWLGGAARAPIGAAR